MARVQATSSSLAYRHIKDRIIDLSYRPNQRLSESRLADEVGLGRSPIRTALARLEGEGWIEVSPQSGTFVRALSDREIVELTELRAILESHCIGVAVAKATGDDIERLQAGFAAATPKIRAGDAEAFIALDEDLHGLIYRLADNRMIADTLTGLRDKVQWIRRACAVSEARVQDGFAEIAAIFAAFAARDVAAARARMREHVENAARFCQMSGAAPRRTRRGDRS